MYLTVPTHVIFRLESNHKIIKEEKFIATIEVDDKTLKMIEDTSLRSGKTFDKVVMDTIAGSYAGRLGKDKQKAAWFEKKAKKYRCNILTEVVLDGKIKMVDHLPDAA